MALQSGWKILNVNISNGGSGYGSSQTYTLSVRTKSKHGQSFAGTCSSNGSGVIVSTNITNNGENYSSGSTTLGILDAPGHGAMLVPIIGQNVSMSISDINQEIEIIISSNKIVFYIGEATSHKRVNSIYLPGLFIRNDGCIELESVPFVKSHVIGYPQLELTC